MKFKDNCIFRLYDLKKNNEFVEEDGKRIWVYEMEEGITELLELIYDRAFNKYGTSLEDLWEISIDFTDNSYKFENAKDALEVFRDKNTNDLKSASIYFSSCGVYAYTDFEINHDEGIFKKIKHSGYLEDLLVDGQIL